MTRKLFSGLAFAAWLAAAALNAQQPASPPATSQPAPPAQAPAARQPAAQPTGGQTGPQGDANAPTIIRLGVNEVNLIFTVTDKHGHYIPDLHQSDFALLDDGRAPTRVNSFHQQINLPLRVGIVIDAVSYTHLDVYKRQRRAGHG